MNSISLINDTFSPIALNIYDTSLMPWHCHSDIELIYLLRGEISIRFLDRTAYLHADDIILINSGELHELRAEAQCLFISLKIKISLLNSELCKGLRFYCDSTTETNKMKFYLMKHCIAELVKLFTTENELKPFFNRSIAYLFLNELSMHFMPEVSRTEVSAKHIERFLKISTFVNENYGKNLTLEDVSRAVGLQSQYVSLLFTRHFNMNFLSYYNEIRISHAINKLIATNIPIEQIAEECGFGNARTFGINFKKKYGVSPSTYRKTMIAQKKGSPQGMGKDDYLKIIAEYLPPKHESSIDNVGIMTDIKFLNIAADVTEEAGEFHCPYKKCVALSSANEALYADVQDMLKMAQREIHFDFAGFITDDNDSSSLVADKAIALFHSLGMALAKIERKEITPETDPRISNLKDISSSESDSTRDTCFGMCSFIKRILECGKTDGYIHLIDVQSGNEPSLFVGGKGIFTFNGIKKPLYHALCLLNKLGNKQIAKGKGYVIVRNGSFIQILLYNYEHLGELYIAGSRINDTFIERYQQVAKLSRMNTEISLKGLISECCEVREYILNQTYGSAFDEWITMGRPSINDPDIDRLKRVCEPKILIRSEKTSGGELLLYALLEPFELRLIEIQDTKKNDKSTKQTNSLNPTSP